MSAGAIHFEPTDPPDLPIIPVDRATFESVVVEHQLVIEVDTAAGVQVVTLDGLVFAAPLTGVAS